MGKACSGTASDRKGSLRMTFLKILTSSVLTLAAIQTCSAQKGFPLRSGEWEAKLSVPGDQSPPVTMLYCLNDALWEKALTQDPDCAIRQLSITGGGASYAMDCETKTYQMKGNVNLIFDGMEHMTGNGKVEITMGGKTSSSGTLVDYRWKGATCSSHDVNLRPKKVD